MSWPSDDTKDHIQAAAAAAIFIISSLVLVFQLFLLSQSDICRRCLICIFLCENIWLGSVYGILEANSGALRGGRLEGKGKPAGEPF